MPELVLRKTNGEELRTLKLTEEEFAAIHTVTIDRDKHRLYFSLKYTFHAELRNEGEPSKSEAKRKTAQTRGK